MNKISSENDNEISTSPSQIVHQDCRRDYTSSRSTRWTTNSTEEKEIENERDLRSSTPYFKFKDDCLFCGQTAQNNKRKRGYEVVCVRTLEFQSSIEDVCKMRNDKWGDEVYSRIQMAYSDLHAADAAYHSQCNSNFRTGNQIPQTVATTPEDNLKRRTLSFTGRPKNDTAENCFHTIMARIEKGRIQISIVDLVREMEKLCGVDNTYSVIHMKKKVQEYFGDSIVLTEQDRKPSVLTFRDNVSSILHDFYTRVGKGDREEEKRTIISTVAQLIREDIKTLPSRDNYYPSANEIVRPQMQIMSYIHYAYF